MIFLKKESGKRNDFYGEVQKDLKDKEKRAIQRQAFAGMLWNKQFYNFDISRWLNGDPSQPQPPDERLNGRNSDWIHLNNDDVISMPDKWEYPWYACMGPCISLYTNCADRS